MYLSIAMKDAKVTKQYGKTEVKLIDEKRHKFFNGEIPKCD